MIGVIISAIVLVVSSLLSQGTNDRAPAAREAITGDRPIATGDTSRMVARLPAATAPQRSVVRAGLLKLGTGAAEYRLYPRRDLTPVALHPYGQ